MDAQESPRMLVPVNVPGTTDKLALRPAPRRTRLRPAVIVAAAIVTLAVLGAGFVGMAKATDSPTFCGTTCHEMSPYHQAWSAGPHKGIACIECHLDPSPVARLEHKVVALQEVVDHIKGAPSFPLAQAPDVPDSRCTRCHQSVTVKVAGFSHADHAKRGPCVKCHADAGHNVTTVALKQAGILQVAYRHAIEPTTSATPGQGKAIVGHISVGCTKCHDMPAMKCSQCHTPGPKHQGRPSDCTQCHAPGPKFVFTHPVRLDCETCHARPTNLTPPHPTKGECTLCHLSGPGVNWLFTHPQITTCGDCHALPSSHTWPIGACTDCHLAGPGKSFAFTHPARSDCQTCHTPPANHHHDGACATCHHNRGVNWAFSHPTSSATCTDCHTRPSGHRSGVCQTCHKQPGVKWTFTHPSSSATCANCHTRPSGHKSGTCQTCHKKPGVSWAFTHPSPGATCANCHARPSGHNSVACQTCHKNAGKTWAFTHPSATANCASCHTRPSGHSAGQCSTCHHNTGVSFAFTHPTTPAPHGITGRTCVSCHPSGYTTHYCSCHGSANGPSGD